MHRSSPRRLRRSQRLQVSAMEPTAKLKLCTKKRWRNWITGGCEKGGWHRVSRIKEKRVREGKVEYNVALTGWGRNQKDSWVSSDDVTPKCIEAWRKASARRILIPTIQDFVAPSFSAAQGPAPVRCIPGKNDPCVTPLSPPLLYLQNLVL